MGFLVGLVGVLFIVMVLGHGLWVFVASLFRVFFGQPAQPTQVGSRSCVGCGVRVALGAPWCPQCSLDFSSEAAADLRNLESTARQLQALLDRGILDQETCDRVYAGIETRQNQLLQGTAAGSQARPRSLGPRQELRRLLASVAGVQELSVAQRQRALAVYRQLSKEELAGLEAPVLHNLALLLETAGLASRALKVYQLLLLRHPVDEEGAAIAVRAARLAQGHEQPDLVRTLLEPVLSGSAPPALLAEARELLSKVEEPELVILVEAEAASGQRPAAIGQAPVVGEPTASSRQPTADSRQPAADSRQPIADSRQPIADSRPRRTLGQLLAVFMEERNILWGELVGGGLIVGCSTALVISLWQTLEQIPFFPFLILAGITVALFGAGFYTLSHWRLESTSRGLLVIATLLVPMDFVVLAGLSRGAEGGLLELTTDAVSLLVFGFLIQRAGGVLLGLQIADCRLQIESQSPIRNPQSAISAHWLLPLAVLGASASTLLVTRLLIPGEDNPLRVTLLAFVPVGCHVLALAGQLRTLLGQSSLARRQANQLFIFLGMASFAAVVALGFLLYRCEDWTVVLPRLALPVAVLGVPILISGALVQGIGVRGQGSGVRKPETGSQESEEQESEGADASHSSFIIHHSTFSAVALAGVVVMLLGLGLAWPRPVETMVVGTLNFVTLLTVALVLRFPAAQVPALVCLVMAYLTAWLSWQGQLDVAQAELGRRWLSQAVASGTGLPLAVLAALLAGSAEWLMRRDRRPDGLCHAWAAGFLGLGALTMVTLPGPPYDLQTMAVYGLGSVVGLLANVRWRWPLLSYVCGFLLLGGTFFWPAWQQLPLFPWRDLVLALLGQATLLILVCLVGPSLWGGSWSWLEPVFLKPWRQVSLLSSLFTPVALVLALGWDWTAAAAGCLVWLAFIWLVFAGTEKRAGFFAAFQITLSLGVVMGCTAWLQRQAWVIDLPNVFLCPRGWHAYTICLAVLALGWLLLRLAVRRPEWLRDFLTPPWPALDGVILFLLILGQLFLAAAGVYPGVERELAVRDSLLSLAAWPDWAVQVFEPGAWWAFGLLALAVVGYRLPAVGYQPIADGRSPIADSGTPWVTGLLLLLLTAPLLAAGAYFGEDRVVASACRWGLALAFLAGSLPFWCRGWLEGCTARWRLWPESSAHLGGMRRLLVFAAVTPVLLLTLGRVVPRLVGIRLAGPLPDTWFWHLGTLMSLLVPLGLVGFSLAVHGFRERFPGYLLAVGLILLAGQMGGYALAVVRRGEPLDGVHWVRIVQTGLLVAAAWAILWALLGRWLGAGEGRGAVHQAPQLRYFLGGAWLAPSGLLAWAILLLVVLTLDNFPPHGLPALKGIRETGSYLGWAGLGLLAVGWGLLSWLGGKQLSFHFWAGTSLLASGLLACTAEGLALGAGYATLQLALGVFLVALAAIGWRAERVAVVSWSEVTGLLAVGLAWSLAAVNEGHLWSALSLALVGLGLVMLAVRWRREIGAYLGGLCFLQSAALIVWHFQRHDPVATWFMLLIQVTLIVAAVAALAWLAGRKWVYETSELSLPSSPWLALKVALVFLGNVLLFVVPVLDLLIDPAGRGLYVADLGSVGGWLAVVLALAAACWYLRLVAPAQVVHVAGIGGLLLGVAAAGSVSYWDTGIWLCQHTLTMAWSLLGLLILTAGWTGTSVRAIGPLFWAPPRRERAAALLAECFPALAVRRWLGGYGLLVAALALRGAWGDPGRPYWSCGATLAVCALYAALALWSRQQFFVYASGLLLNLAGFLVWKAWVSERLEALGALASAAEIVGHFVYIQVICLALASGSWSALEAALRRRQPPLDLRGHLYPFCQTALLMGLHLLGIMIGLGLASDLAQEAVYLGGTMAWATFAVMAGALALSLGDPRQAGSVLLQLHFLCLLAIGLLLHGWQLAPADLGWAAALLLGGYVLLTAAAARCGLWITDCGLRKNPLQSAIRNLQSAISDSRDFVLAQLLVAALVVGLSWWTCLHLAIVSLRLMGPLSALLLMLAAAVSYRRTAGGAQSAALGQPPAAASPWSLPVWLPCYLTLGLGVLVSSELYWAFLEPTLPEPWLQRTAGALVAVVLLAVIYRVVLGRSEASASAWRTCGWQAGSWLGLAGAGLVLVMLAQEMAAYEPVTRHTPLVLPSIILAASAVAGLVGLTLRLALAAGADPFGVPAKSRTWYVYAAEALLVLLFAHLRLNVPDLIPAWLTPYWPLLVMGLAFVLMGLGEWWQGQGIPILAGPLRRTALFLPMVPLLCFQLRPLAGWRAELSAQLPGLQPLFRYLDRLPEGFGQHALVWLLTGLLLGWLAWAQRWGGCGLLSALACNFAAWVVLGNSDHLVFPLHPQLWLIPLGLILLAADFLYRQRLPPASALALRYLGLLLIYVSSTADMFITGLGHSVLLPITLAVLSILGVLGGILFRVRAFLLGGVAFLFLVIFAQIWHAAVDRGQTWVWWASGIVLGAAILTMFALFEKHRNDMLKMIDDLKRWR